MIPKQFPRLLAVRDLVKIYGLTAKSQLSQNFILDKNITDKIVKYAKISQNDTLVVEVGPGPGLLTRSILETGISNIVQLAEASEHTLKIIKGDMLKIDHEKIMKAAHIDEDRIQVSNLHLIGNLPFNIASSFLVQWIKMLSDRSGIFKFSNITMTLMFQKEVGDRIIADTTSPQRGRMSVLVQSFCEVKKIYEVPSSVFVPRPKVDASVIQLTALPNPFLKVKILNLAPVNLLEEIVGYFYLFRRKTLNSIFNKLQKNLSENKKEIILKIIEQLNVDMSLRPENLTAEQFCYLTKLFYDNSLSIPKN
ncbi:S-adenosyl-L-methionine-dependent methyltransferase [Rhizophagus irregularis]|uniref:rRNA adenine N(6)-methyltransferase n=2 Tax=Rhizophagus irregularis TaxID=588596 RepID=A0A2I1EB38_9GLOM|nr:S-adenosyl-L-methionine-dependent methyltransferase [Rhizophagus irregularis DAOM 181602=DAOM 197198]PKC09817.1 S-adenosyl-L-methionine-dependent methyltransferase [Rhizophagus irregularis]PKC66582.1 S-adenosyl-L-methionine-dependent methyltransferase [Rhizophagus irregularis]PKY19320.1 S-adenosyl-L-methionine-dependent methyltransferase [Rhizophagus irregularis]POG75098.1 S-adenosyl-L-methionine-dependent methyltransferase [Rhizophagus irregularis DAOM 181602=DAOM 197198]|eukprot:XP_025181964.1 S-adenosyl-L-methionine-dependent methyltransferase [Rhizophagus irregularis DAOM 181602=DAOM 197198]